MADQAAKDAKAQLKAAKQAEKAGHSLGQELAQGERDDGASHFRLDDVGDIAFLITPYLS